MGQGSVKKAERLFGVLSRYVILDAVTVRRLSVCLYDATGPCVFKVSECFYEK